MRYKIAIISFVLLFSILWNLSYSASTAPQPVINCPSLFTSTGNQYLPKLAAVTGYSSLVSVAVLIILAVLMITGIVYAFGFAFQVQSLLNFAKSEFLESAFNLVLIAAVGFTVAFAASPLYFLTNLASSQASGSGTSLSGTSTQSLYTTLCENVQNNIVISGIANWFGVFLNLYITEILAVGTPPNGGLTLHIMPNGDGVAFTPFQGLTVVTALLWDMQTTYFGSIFMGMFIIILLFLVYFLFPIFFYVGIVLRSFPWTRAAGGSFIAMFISFYIVFPALIYPFSINNSVNQNANPGGGQGFCSNSQFSSQFGQLCNSGSFITSSFGSYTNLVNFDFGSLYYSEVYGFIEGIEFIGLNLIGLIIALIISYEMIEKIGSLLGSPSLQGSRALSRIL